MKICLLFIASFVAVVLANDHTSFEGYNVWSVLPKTADDVGKLRMWSTVKGIDIWQLGRPGKIARIMVAPATEHAFLIFLKNTGMEYELLIENVERNFETERKEQRLALDRLAKLPEIEGQYTVDFNHFWTVDEINNYINHLNNFHRDICRVNIIGHSIQGKLIRSVEISLHGQIDGSRPIIFIDAGVHAREWIAYMVAVKIMHELISHRDHNLDILENVDWVIIPMVNPDGYEYTHNTYRLWRKNRRINENPNCIGVDGNRNYAREWRPVANQCSETYSGTEPFSEPEIQAVRSIIDRFGTNIKLYASIHSYGDYVLYPWGYDYIYIDNWEQHQEVGDRFADAVYAVNGTVYDVGNASYLLYPAYGASDDFMADQGVTISYTVELSGGGQYGFDLPADRIQSVTNEVWLGFREFGLYTSAHNWD